MNSFLTKQNKNKNKNIYNLPKFSFLFCAHYIHRECVEQIPFTCSICKSLKNGFLPSFELFPREISEKERENANKFIKQIGINSSFVPICLMETLLNAIETNETRLRTKLKLSDFIFQFFLFQCCIHKEKKIVVVVVVVYK